MRRRVLLALPLAAPAVAAAQEWTPSRPIRIVVPFTPGGAADNGARMIGARLAETLGQQVVIENRGGGAGAIAANAVLEAPRDGHALFWAGQAVFVTNPHLYERLSYRPEDFIPVSIGTRLPMVLPVHPSFPAQNLAEWRDRVRGAPGRYSYATVGRGGMTHVFGEMIEAEMGLDLQDVPYRGSAPALQDLLAGNIPMSVDGLIPALNHHRAGTLRILAVSSERRLGAAPDLPTFAEQGWPNLTAYLWFGLFAPRGTPEAAIRRLAAAMQEAAQRPDIRARMEEGGVEPAANTPEQFAALVAEERARWGPVIRRAGIRLTE
ncbi:MAG: tripartite tricarboxylate transporter substrate binding protein [Acetobacteraceae bacterium]|nr:tripartite tricarboxylate transporter substrate binding protein [Acetobacteraceae bacterium]